MSLAVSLITPSYIRDLESCRLLCETIDAYASGFETHYVVVPDADIAAFAALERPHRHVVAESDVLPARLYRLPATWKGRRYYWMAGVLPVYGWHTQQLRKFAMALAQPNPRVMFIDSDNVLVRPFDLAGYAGGASAPLYVDRGAVAADSVSHTRWLRSAHRLLGLAAPAFPADDFIGQMVVWDVETARRILERIEATTGMGWARAMLRERDFSEYMIYGAGVTADPALIARHEVTAGSPCLAYWQGGALSAAELARFAQGLGPAQSAIAVQSFTQTPLDLLRSVAFGRELAL